MEKVPAFKTSDGVLFENEVDAKKHQGVLDFEAWYEENKIYGEYGYTVDCSSIKEWLLDNRTTILKLLNGE